MKIFSIVKPIQNQRNLNIPLRIPQLPRIEGNEISYIGSSMYPTFINGDRLTFDRRSRITSGDIIVYAEPEGERYIIHRVIGIQGNQVQTAGDTNQSPDSYLLDRQKVVGKVIMRNRLTKATKVRGGIIGIIQYRYWQPLLWRIIHLFKQKTICYEFLARHTIPGKLLSPFLRVQLVVLIKDGKDEIQLFLNEHYAGVRKGADRPWVVRPPFRLFINPNQLQEYGVIVRLALETEIRRKSD
jgi:signal peptidase I